MCSVAVTGAERLHAIASESWDPEQVGVWRGSAYGGVGRPPGPSTHEGQIIYTRMSYDLQTHLWYSLPPSSPASFNESSLHQAFCDR